MSGAPAPIVAEDLQKSYGEVTALDGLSLSVASGEVVALVGPNGAGKTTLVRCLTGTVAPDDGEARLFDGPPAAADRERVGLLPQAFAPPGRLTAPELARYYASLYDSARDPDAVLSTVGLGDSIGATWYENLSGGQQRRACVAAALVNDPDVLFLDEPTTGIDPEGRRAVWGVLETLVDTGTTILLTTHDMAEAARLGDRVAVMVGGRLVAVDTPEALIDAHGGARTLRVTPVEDVREIGVHGLGFSVRIDSGEVVVECGPTEVAAILRALDEAGVTFEAIEWHEPTLDDVYVALAGDAERSRGTVR